jgi:polar amino acid transport system substrate-binding protein
VGQVEHGQGERLAQQGSTGGTTAGAHVHELTELEKTARRSCAGTATVKMRAKHITRATLLIAGLVLWANTPTHVVAQQPAEPTAQVDADRREGSLPRRVAIRFLTDDDYPPFNYYDEDNVLTGFNIDVARGICLELAAACDIQVRPWQELLAALRRGEADAVIASHAVSASALRAVDFTNRYYNMPARFAGKRATGRLDVTPEGLEGKKIAVAKGTAHEAYLRTFFRDSAVRAFETPELARDALITGAVDLLFDDGVSLAFWLNGTGSKACCEFKGGPFAEPKYFGDGVGIAVNREDVELKMLMNTALKRMRESGRFEELLLRYFPLRVF